MQDIIRANYEMTAEECDLYVKLFQKAEADQRFYLLKIREEKGWKAKGYESFEDFGKGELGLEVARLYQMAKAAEVHLSLPDYTNGIKIPERQLRPLAPLTDDERRQVWNEATAKAEADQKKLTAKMVQEAVDRLTAEKAELQSNLDLVFQEKEEFRKQYVDEMRAGKEKTQLIQTAQTESATLRRTLAAEADKLADAKILETRLEVSHAKEEASKLKESIKALKREREDAIQRGVQNKLREQQSSLDAKEAQLVSIEQRIDFLKNQLTPMEGANKAIARHRPLIAKIDHDINEIAVFIGDAFDPSKCPAPPEEIIREWEHGAQKIRQLADMIHLALRGALPHE